MSTYNPFSLQGKTILITGASSGIGRSTAIECSRLGANLILTDINIEGLKETLLLLEGKETNHRMIIANLAKEDEIEILVNGLSKLDGCVFSAGISATKTLPFYSKSDFDKVFDVNFFGPVLLTKQLVKNKQLNKECSLVYISSIAGNDSFKPGNGIYGASKSALSSFVRFAGVELASKKIRVNEVCPAMVQTPLVEKLPLSQEEIELDKSKYLMKRYATPQEIALGCVYLLSDASSFMTGQSLILDGGRLLN
jgi:NAD(P)-dependent dehydrogenase (short-subunit alcohol dehydrogenase family)